MVDTLNTIINTPVGSAATGISAAAAIDVPNTGHSTIDLVLKAVIAVIGIFPAIKQLFGKKKRKQNSETEKK